MRRLPVSRTLVSRSESDDSGSRQQLRQIVLGAYFPFAGGAHTCIGKFFASYLFKNVIYKYIQSIQNPRIDHVLDIRPTPIPHPVKDVKVLI